MTSDDADRLALADQQIETLLGAVWPEAEAGKVVAVDAARRLIELRARLHGGLQQPKGADQQFDDELAAYRRRHVEPAG